METLLKTISEYEDLKLDQVIDYSKFNDYAITAHSTQLEGSTLTMAETSLLLNEGITPKGKDLDHSNMARDHYEAIKYIHSLKSKQLVLTPQLIKNINSKVMRRTGSVYNTALGSIDASRGEYRKGSVYVEKRYFPSYDKVPHLVEKLCSNVNEKLKSDLGIEGQLKLSYSSHFLLVSIHPFYDGNGRTSRLLMNTIQEHYNLPLSVVYKEDRLEYFQALEDSREKDQLSPIIDFMASQHEKFLRNEIKLHNEQAQKMNKNNGLSFLL